jgi:hypothetical protein
VVRWRKLGRIFLVLVLVELESGCGVEERILFEEKDGLEKGI